MSFGFSVGDFISLIALAKTTYKNCVEAGPEYNDIARQIRSLHGVLRPLRDEAEKADSGLFRQDAAAAEELTSNIDGCNHILEDLQILLAKYEGLSTDGEPVGAPKKLWHRFRFSTKLEQLAAVKAKIVSYTSNISVLLDTVQLRATGRVENKLNDVSSQLAEGFAGIKKVILEMAVQARVEQRGGSTLSLLSLSTYAGDDKEIWQEFRRELIGRGFRSKALDRHKDLLQAYMLKLDQSGFLDEVDASSGQNVMEPWWKKHAFAETVNTLHGLQPIDEEASSVSLNQSAMGKILTPPPPEYSVTDTSKVGVTPKLAPSVDQDLVGPKNRLSPGLQNPKELDTPESKTISSGVLLPRLSLTLDTDSEESEKETSDIKRPQRSRTKRRHNRKSLDFNTVDLAADLSTRTASEIPHSSSGHEDNVRAGASAPIIPARSDTKQTSILPPEVPTRPLSEKSGNMWRYAPLESPLTGSRDVPQPKTGTRQTPDRVQAEQTGRKDRPQAHVPQNQQAGMGIDMSNEILRARDQRAERRKEAKEVRDYANTPNRQSLGDVSAATTKDKGRPIETKSRNSGTLGRTESPKARERTTRAKLARPLPSHAYSDPTPRLGTERNPQTQRREVAGTGKGTGTSSLGAVAFGLAGLSLLLGMRKRNKAREARGRNVSDGYFSYYSDSYTQTSDSDDDDDESSDDENPPRNWREGQEGNWRENENKNPQRKVSPTAGGSKTTQKSVNTQPLRAYVESASGSDSDRPGIKAPNTSDSLQPDIEASPGSGSSTPQGKTRTGKAAKAGGRSNDESVKGRKEFLSALRKAEEAGTGGNGESAIALREYFSAVRKAEEANLRPNVGTDWGSAILEAAEAWARTNDENGTGPTEKLTSAETSNKATESSPSGAQEENLERRFVINSRT